MLVRFAYLAVAHAFAALRLLPMADRERDVEILALRHQVAILQRQLGDQRPRLRPEDRAFLAALLVPLSRGTLRRPLLRAILAHQRLTVGRLITLLVLVLTSAARTSFSACAGSQAGTAT